MIHRFAWALFAFAVAGSARCDNGDMIVRHFTTTDGLPVGSAAAALADGDGFLWVATHDGLARFDGRKFDVHDAARTRHIAGNRFVALARDATGRVVARAADGTLVRARGGVLEAVPGSGGPADRVGDARFLQSSPLCVTRTRSVDCEAGDRGFVHALALDPAAGVHAALRAGPGRFWLVSRRGILLQTGRALPRRIGDRHLVGPGTQVPVAQVDGRGNLWVATHRGIARAGLDGRIAVYPYAGGAKTATVVQIRVDRSGRAWIGSDRGLFRIDEDSAAMLPVELPGLPTSGLAGSWQGPDGALWISRGGHLARDGRMVMTGSGEVRDVGFDPSGTAWVSTLRDGLYALSPPRVDVIDRDDGLLGDNVYGVDAAADGSLWIGTLGSGLHVRRADGRIEHFGRKQGLPGENVRAVAVAPDGGVFAASYLPGLYWLAPGAVAFEAVPLPPAAAHAQVLSISFDASGRPWLGTREGAWRRDAAGWRRAWPEHGSARVGAVLHAVDGSTWFGSDRGLHRMHHGDVAEVAAQQVGGVAVRSLFQDAAGTVWASTEGRGLVSVAVDDPGGGAAKRLGRADGLPSNSPHAVLQDAQGHLWINSNQGIHRLTPEGLAGLERPGAAPLLPLTLGLTDGLAELEGNGGVQPAGARDRDGILWLPTQRGVVRIDPAQLPVRRNQSRTVIDLVTDLRSGQALDPGQPLSPGVRSIRIHYSAADLHGGGGHRFRYRLLPEQPRWSTDEAPGVASFMGLGPGRYRFEVVAANGDGVWQRQPSSVAFSVPFFWYETLWSKLVGLLLLAGAAALFLRWRMRELRARAVELERKVRDRTRALSTAKAQAETALADLACANTQLEQGNLTLAAQAERLEGVDAFRSRLLADIGHELRTPLMLIGASLREVEAGDALSEAIPRRRIHQSLQQVERLEKLVDQLVQLVLAEARQIELCFRRVAPGEFVRDAMAAFHPIARRAALAFEIEAGECLPWILADTSLLTTILGNLVSNACRHAPRGSVVRARVDHLAATGYVRITVADEGPGIPAQVAERMFDRFYRDPGNAQPGRGSSMGIGLALARELVQLHGGRIGADAAAGASFWIDLPTGTAHVSLEEIATADPGDSTGARPGPAPSATAVRQHRGDHRALLLLEDDHGLGDYLEEHLSEHADVRRARSADEARALLDDDDFAVVLADVVLPGTSGVDLCRQLRCDARWDDVPVVLMSASSSRDDLASGLAAGAAAYLAKPFSLGRLLDVLGDAWPALAESIQRRHAQRDSAATDPLIALAAAAIGDSSFGVSKWAEGAHLSERQLRRRVVELTGQPPQTWLRERRLEKVRELVSAGRCRTLAQAATLAGFDNVDYLYRLYRARYGRQGRLPSGNEGTT